MSNRSVPWKLVALGLAPVVAAGALLRGTVVLRQRQSLRELEVASGALSLLVDSLPHLRTGLNHESAAKTALLLRERLGLAAVAIVNRSEVLAFVGAGDDHHLPGEPIKTDLTRLALQTGRVQVAQAPAVIHCPIPGCPLTSGVVVPLKVRGESVGCLKLYQTGRTRVQAGEVKVAAALGKLIGAQLELAQIDAQTERVVAAELKALRAQISPHFLFNTLNTIAALTRIDPETAHTLIVDFAHFFRETLKRHGEFCTLAEELAYVERYLTFERARLGERLRVQYDTQPETHQALVPVLVVQPLVENAVNHGIAYKIEGGDVSIVSARHGDEVRITVVDTGVGIAPDQLAQVLQPGYGTGLGMGLSNVNERLRGLYGPAYALDIESRPGEGTSVRLRIPTRYPQRDGG
ncbi:MAG: histidine kinase [Chloroflexi bacterium]|nr:histidine kinase [Chloroflexota bacterium]